LRLQVFEFDGRDEDQGIEDQQRLGRLQCAQVLQERFHPAHHQLTLLVFVSGIGQVVGEVDTGYEEFQFISQVQHCFHERVVFGLCDKVVDGGGAAHNVEKEFVESDSDLEKTGIVGLTDRSQLVRRPIHHHLSLMSLEEKQDAHDRLKVLLAPLLEVGLRALELLFPFLLQYLEVEVEEAQHAKSFVRCRLWMLADRLKSDSVSHSFICEQATGKSDTLCAEVILDEHGHDEDELL